MRALSGQAAVVQHQDPIRVFDCGGALGDQKYRGPRRIFPDRLPQGGVGGKIESGRAVIENQNLGTPHQRPRNRKPLALAAGKIAPALLDPHFQSLPFGVHELPCLRRIQRLIDFRVGGVPFPPEHIFTERPLKQHRLLRYDADHFPQPFQRIVPYVNAADQNGPRRGVIESGNQVHQRGFAGAGAADDADGLAAERGKINIRQRFFLRPGVGEIQMSELNFRHGDGPRRAGERYTGRPASFRGPCRPGNGCALSRPGNSRGPCRLGSGRSGSSRRPCHPAGSRKPCRPGSGCALSRPGNSRRPRRPGSGRSGSSRRPRRPGNGHGRIPGTARGKRKRLRSLHCLPRGFPVAFLRNTPFHRENRADAVGAGQGFGNRDDQIGQFHQFHEDLGHIVDQGDHFALRNHPVFNLPRPGPDQNDGRGVDNDIGQRVHQGGNLSHKNLGAHQQTVLPFKFPRLGLLPVKGPHHPGPQQILTGRQKHPVQLLLHFFIKRHTDQQHAEHDH